MPYAGDLGLVMFMTLVIKEILSLRWPTCWNIWMKKTYKN